MSEVVDMMMGRYRKGYEHCRTGRRINAVSPDAEMLFWRLNFCVADDFGNFLADPEIVRHDAIPLRDLTVERVQDLLAELIEVKLVKSYDALGERYGHIDGFITRQSSKNGKLYHKHPPSPWDREELLQLDQIKKRKKRQRHGEGAEVQLELGESGGIQNVAAEPENAELKMMRDHGVDDATASLMLKTYGAEMVRRACGRMDQYGKKKKIDDPSGYIITILKGGFSTPKPARSSTFTSTREREAAADAAAAARHFQRGTR